MDVPGWFYHVQDVVGLVTSGSDKLSTEMTNLRLACT